MTYYGRAYFKPRALVNSMLIRTELPNGKRLNLTIFKEEVYTIVDFDSEEDDVITDMVAYCSAMTKELIMVEVTKDGKVIYQNYGHQ